jgi:uncharacterized protein
MDSNVPPPLPEWAHSEPNDPKPPGTPWEFWPTIAFSFGIGILYLIAQGIAAVCWVLMLGLSLDVFSRPEELTHEGGVIAYATLASTIVGVGCCVLIARTRPGITLKEYFAWRWPTLRVAAKWTLGFFVYLVACSLASSFLDTSATEEFARAIQEVNGATKVLLWIALYVGAPVTEELFFRGFLFVGIQRSRLGGIGAIAITTAIFAMIHVQYDLQGLLMVSAAGVFFGLVRHKTNSLPLCMALHSLMNVIATLGNSPSGE